MALSTHDLTVAAIDDYASRWVVLLESNDQPVAVAQLTIGTVDKSQSCYPRSSASRSAAPHPAALSLRATSSLLAMVRHRSSNATTGAELAPVVFASSERHQQPVLAPTLQGT
jgi:hypothetical protein